MNKVLKGSLIVSSMIVAALWVTAYAQDAATDTNSAHSLSTPTPTSTALPTATAPDKTADQIVAPTDTINPAVNNDNNAVTTNSAVTSHDTSTQNSAVTTTTHDPSTQNSAVTTTTHDPSTQNSAVTTTTHDPSTQYSAAAAEHHRTATPQSIFEDLQAGNQRFVDGNLKYRDLLAQVNKTATAQFPEAVILNCIDSRTPPEIVFDQGIGEVFAIRIAGNIQNSDILGSMEFGTKVVGAKLIVVIGHTRCGAIKGACQQVKLGNLTGLLRKIQPAVQRASKETGKKDCDDYGFVDQIAKDNVLLVMKQIQANSPILRRLIQTGKIGIVGGIQDIATGKVTFFDEGKMIPNSTKVNGDASTEMTH